MYFHLPLPVAVAHNAGGAALLLTLVLVNYQPEPWHEARWLGLILEQATDTLRCDPAEFQPYGLDNRQARYLGPVREDERGLMQWIGVADLLTADVQALLFAAGEEG